jgi:ABC-type lipoprotein export system ATPase subunit
VIVVTHDSDVARRAARVIRMLDGRLVASDQSSNLLTSLSAPS